MTVRTAVLACVLALVVVTGGVAGPVGASIDGSDAERSQVASLQPTPTQNGTIATLTECTAITESGQYVLGNDIGPATGDDPCVEILANNVTLDGDGYAVDGVVTLGEPGSTEEIRDTVIRDLTAISLPATDGIRGLTLESVDLEGGLYGLFITGLAVNDSRMRGILASEDSGDIVVTNSTFTGQRALTFWEYVQTVRIENNEFKLQQRSSFAPVGIDIQSTGSDTRDILIANNRIDAGGGVGISTSEGVHDIEVRDNEITNASVGIDFLSSGHITGNDVHDNDVGISILTPFGLEGDFLADNNSITDNQVGVSAGELGLRSPVRFRDNLIAGNSEFGVRVTDQSILDARNNDWGDPSGPSSAPANDSDAPFADPVTGALANGSGDAVSEGETPGVSNVRFDPISGVDEPVDPEPEPEPTPEPTPEPEPEPTPTPEPTPEPEPEPEPAVAFYQVDFAAGPVIEQLGSGGEAFYSEQSRLIRFLHGSDGQVDRVGSPSTLAAATDECVAAESFDVANDTATVRFTVAEGCELVLSLSSYEKPGPGWSRATASEQRLVDAAIGTFGPGTHTLTVALPTDTAENESVGVVE